MEIHGLDVVLETEPESLKIKQMPCHCCPIDYININLYYIDLYILLYYSHYINLYYILKIIFAIDITIKRPCSWITTKGLNSFLM